MQSAPLLLLTVAVVAAAAAAVALPTAAVPRHSTPTQPPAETDARPARVENSLKGDETITLAEATDETTPYNAASKRELKQDSLNGWDKLRRIQEIKEYIYNSTRTNMGTPYKSQNVQNIMTTNDLKTLMLSIMPPMDDPSKKINSFYPLCAAVQSKKVEATKNSDDMYMIFNLTYPTSTSGSKVVIGSANLRLWRITQTESSVSVDPCSPYNQQVRVTPTPTSSTTQTAEPSNPASSSSTSTTSTTSSPLVISEPREVFVRVTISYLVRQGKKSNKLTRYILDSKMVSTNGEGWVDFNVLNAVKDWQNANNNMGLFVEVEDQERKKLPAASFFREMNCTAGGVKPQGGDNGAPADLGGASMHPVISLCTADLSNAANTDPHAVKNNPLSKTTEDFARLLGLLQGNAEKTSTTEKQPAAAAEEEQVAQEQVQNTEGHQEHHQLRHHNRHNHHHRGSNEAKRQQQEQQPHRNGLRGHSAFHAALTGEDRPASERPRRLDVFVVPLVLKTSRVAEMDEEIEEVDQKPITIEQLFQR